MKFTAKQIGEFLNGTIEGNPDVEVQSISKIEEGKEGTISFLANPKYSKYIYTTESSIVLINNSFELEKEVHGTLIRVEDAYKSFASLLNLYNNNNTVKKEIAENSFIDSSAKIGKDIYVGQFAFIGKNSIIGNNVQIFPQVYIGDNVTIADNTVLYPGVKVFNDCKIGKNCILHGGTIIGSDGFGFAPKSSKDYMKVPQIGNVIIDDDVEIGSNVSIDRATIGSTKIKKGVKIDNLVQVAHNVEIGENSVIVAQVGIAGSAKIGKNCIIAGQVGVNGHITIADGVTVGAQSGVTSSVKKENSILLGSPAIDLGNQRRSLILFKKLPELQKEISRLTKLVNGLQKEM